jgi:hypothetical protein
MSDYQTWMLSDEFKKFTAGVLAETGCRYVDTYWSIMGFGKYTCEDWWEMPNMAAFDRMLDSKVMVKLINRSIEQDFKDNSRGYDARIVKTTKEVVITE